MKRLLALILAMLMVFSLAACGGDAPEEASVVQESSEAVSEAPTDETVAEAPAEVPEEEAKPVEEPSVLPEEEIIDPAAIDASHLYPVFDEMTDIDAFLNIAPWASAYIGPDAEFENAQAILTAQEITNVHLNVTWSDPDTYNEKMNLLIAANDLPHITRSIGNLYSTGEDGLIEDGLAVDLFDYFEEYAPNYLALLESNPKFKEDIVASSGVTTAMYSYTEIPRYTRGPLIRKDILDELGMEIPTTVAELYDVASAMKEYGIQSPVVSPKMIADAYAGADFITSNTVNITWWVVDGVVTPAVAMDSNYDWLVEAKKWHEEGLFLDDWYNPAPFYDFDVLAGTIACAYGPYSLASDANKTSSTDPDFELWPMANVVVNEGDTIKTQDNSYGGRGDGDWCITTCDEEIIPQLVSYVNWFFTEEGKMTSNFGTLGVSYEIDENGNPMFTDLILEDPNGYGNMAVYAIFTNNNDNPFYYMMERTVLTYDNEVQATIFDTWLSNMTSEYIANYDMDTEELEAYNALATDVATTIQEYITKFMTGDIELTEETYAAFLDKLNELGLAEMQEISQGAYDRSIA